jgi:hypothetical protein
VNPSTSYQLLQNINFFGTTFFFLILDYVLTGNVTITDISTQTYQNILDDLCNQLKVSSGLADLKNETEGLDIYPFAFLNPTLPPTPIVPPLGAPIENNETYSMVFAFKKKSNPQCT